MRTTEQQLHSSPKESLSSSPEIISWTRHFATKPCLHTGDSSSWKQPGPCPVLLLKFPRSHGMPCATFPLLAAAAGA